MSAPLVAALCAGLAVVLLVPSRPRVVLEAAPAEGRPLDAGAGWLRRHRLLWSVLAAIGVATFVGGPVGLVGALVAGPVTWVGISRSEPADVRRRRDDVRRDLPHVVGLLAAALRAGAGPAEAVAVVCRALPGAAGDRLAAASARLNLGAAPSEVWRELETDPDLAVLGRALARAEATGAPVVGAVERLADDLASSARAGVEDRARAVGVKAAVPLGCASCRPSC